MVIRCLKEQFAFAAKTFMVTCKTLWKKTKFNYPAYFFSAETKAILKQKQGLVTLKTHLRSLIRCFCHKCSFIFTGSVSVAYIQRLFTTTEQKFRREFNSLWEKNQDEIHLMSECSNASGTSRFWGNFLGFVFVRALKKFLTCFGKIWPRIFFYFSWNKGEQFIH